MPLPHLAVSGNLFNIQALAPSVPPGNPPGKPAAATRPPPDWDSAIGRIAIALGLPEDRVRTALAAAHASPGELLRAVREGVADERVQEVALSLKVDKQRLMAALLEAAMDTIAVPPRLKRAAAEGAASFTENFADATARDGIGAAFRGSAEEALGIGLEIVGETIPRIVNHVLAVLAAAGVAMCALGALAIFQTTLFLQLLAIFAGIALIATGLLLFTLAWRLHEATAVVRSVARVAKKWRERSDARREAWEAGQSERPAAGAPRRSEEPGSPE